MKAPHIFKKHIPILFFLLAVIPGRGQENKIDIAAGAGFPEMVNLGLRFQLEQSQVGLYAGTLPGVDDMFYTVGVDYYYHFGGSSNFTQRRPWFVKAGLAYGYAKNEYFKETTLFLVSRIGRDFNLSPRIGISFDIGVFFLLYYDEVQIKPLETPCWLCGGGWVTFGPSFGLSLFYRL